MENVRTRCDLFSLGTGSTPVMTEITSRRFEIYHIKTYVMLERVNEKKKKYRPLHFKGDLSEFSSKQYSYSYIPVHERVIMKDWFIRMPNLNVSAVVLSKRLYLCKTIKSGFFPQRHS